MINDSEHERGAPAHIEMLDVFGGSTGKDTMLATVHRFCPPRATLLGGE